MSSFDSIEASEIKSLSQNLGFATEEWERNRIRAKLDKIADRRSRGRLSVQGDDTPDKEEAIMLLVGHGTDFSVAAYFASWPQHCFEQSKFQQGLSMLHLGAEVDKLSAAFAKGRMPSPVVNAVIKGRERIVTLHPDKYPFSDSAYDILADGLNQSGFNSYRIWQATERALIRKGRPDLMGWYNYAGSRDAVIGFLVDYALTKCDIAQLNHRRAA